MGSQMDNLIGYSTMDKEILKFSIQDSEYLMEVLCINLSEYY